MKKFGIAIHGGGVWQDKMRGPAEEYLRSLTNILNTGREMTCKGLPAIEIVQALNVMMEDDPLFKAGRGSGSEPGQKVTMDAAIMDGLTGNYGSVTTLRNVKNPILLARHVMDKCTESMIVGPGAEEIAKRAGLEFKTNDYFYIAPRPGPNEMGTVGAVALDIHGNLAAASSTGGFPGHKVSEWRVGDTPLIGAGTFADNRNCAISTCGHGEKFVAAGITRRIAGKVEFTQGRLPEIVADTLKEAEASPSAPVIGGIISIDYKGTVAADVTTNFCMACGWVDTDQKMQVQMLGWK